METKAIKTERASVLKPKPDSATLKFGTQFTDHMFLMNYTDGMGWHDPRIWTDPAGTVCYGLPLCTGSI